jgi:hypothetical protein
MTTNASAPVHKKLEDIKAVTWAGRLVDSQDVYAALTKQGLFTLEMSVHFRTDTDHEFITWNPMPGAGNLFEVYRQGDEIVAAQVEREQAIRIHELFRDFGATLVMN